MNAQRTGKWIYDRFEKRLAKGNSFKLIAEERGADLIYRNPMPYSPLYEHGLVSTDRRDRPRLLLPYKANLAVQEYAWNKDLLHNLGLETANKRAAAVVDYSLRHFPSVQKLLKEKKKDAQDLFNGLRDGFLIESLSTAYIANIPISRQAELAAGVGLMKRFVQTVPGFKSVAMDFFDVDPKDDHALRQFADETDLREFCNGYWRKDKYFQRRTKFIDEFANTSQPAFTFVDFEEDGTDDAINLRKTRDSTFLEGTFVWAVEKLGMNKERLIYMLARD